MFLNRQKNKDRVEASRSLMLSYKKFFSSPEGKDVLFDLINRFNGLNPIEGAAEMDHFKKIGSQAVVFYILSQAKMDVAKYDKLLSGDFDNG